MKKQMPKVPKTWNELLDASYVVELTEEQVAIFKLKTGQLDERLFKYMTPEESMAASNDKEAKLRKGVK
jgi:hypothetical protein